MTELEQLLIERACTRLSVDYARHVDLRHYDEFAELFATDAELNTGWPLRGQEAIRKAMHARSDKLRSRHVLTNIHVEVLDADHARGLTYLTLYRHIGAASLTEDAINRAEPAGVGEYHDQFVRTPDGWRFARRELRFAFRNPGAF